MIPLSEGSLDRELDVLTELSPDGADTSCFAFFSSAGSATMGEPPVVVRGRLGDAAELYDDPLGTGSPANLWPADRSWLTWCDIDLWGTRVAGPESVIRELERDDELETIRLPR